MGKNDRLTNRKPSRQAITATPPGAPVPGAPLEHAPRGRGMVWAWVLLAVVLLVVGLGTAAGVAWVTWERAPAGGGAAVPTKGGVNSARSMEEFWEKVERDAAARPRWKPEPWVPASADDRVIDRFAQLRGQADPAALAEMGPARAFPKHPVSQEEADAVQTDFLLRVNKLRVTRVLRGESDGRGGLKATPGRYTLQTKWTGEVPGVAVRTGDGVVPADERMVHNLDLVVDVRGGKVVGVRAEVPDWPW